MKLILTKLSSIEEKLDKLLHVDKKKEDKPKFLQGGVDTVLEKSRKMDHVYGLR